MNGKVYITQEIKNRAKELEGAVKSCSFGVPISCRGTWNTVSELNGAKTVIARAEAALAAEIEKIDDSLYYSPERLGSTEKIFPVQFGLIHKFEDLCMAECIENKGRFLEKIKEYIKEICTMKSWVNAGHDRAFGYAHYKRGCGLVDLYTAGIIWALITCDGCLYEKLEPKYREMMKESVKKRALHVYERKLYGYTDDTGTDTVPLYWLDVYGNWIAVCGGALTAAALYWGDDGKKSEFIAVYEQCMSRYEKSLYDGYCVEGMSYWNYGFSHFIAGADFVLRATGGAVDLYSRGDFLKAASFGTDFELTKGDYPSISDCMFGEKPSAFNIAYYKMRCNEPWELCDEILTEYHSNFVMVLLNGSSFGMEKTPDKDGCLRHYYEKYDVLICRNRERSFAACIKGGTNQEPHNHNDLGSFVISVNGESLVADVGYTKYTNTTFSPERYNEPALNSFGHSVPVAGGMLQGPELFECDTFSDIPPFYAEVTKKNFTDSRDEIELDLTHAYKNENLKSLTRKFAFDREKDEAVICDSYSFSREDSFETAFLTFAALEIHDGFIVLNGKHEKLCVSIPKGCTISVTPIPGVVVNDHKDSVYPVRVGFAVTEHHKSGAVSLVFKKTPVTQ